MKERAKAELIDYTIAILKPDIVSSSKKCRNIIDNYIKKNNFEIYDMKIKVLSKEEIMNLYHKHVDKPYFEEILLYNQKSISLILVLINKENTYYDTNSIIRSYDSPIIRWKNLIGYKDPTTGSNIKINDKNKGLNNLSDNKENKLRQLFGKNIIENAFYGSDTPSDAYRDLTCFYFLLPAFPPKFKFDINKISLSTLLRFLFPVVPNHSDVCGRLDLFAIYGPVLDYHVLDLCFCSECKIVLRKEIFNFKNNNDSDNFKIIKSNKESTVLYNEIDKILSDKFLSERLDMLCEECNKHILEWSHLFSGKLQTHILTNSEIDLEINNINKNSLLDILKAEKGTSANTILSKVKSFNFKGKDYPKEIIYNINHIEKLLSSVETDYYDRYDYKCLQNIILEDRRIRMNYWVATKILNNPNKKFKIPQLINPLTNEEINDMNKPHKFTLLRTQPINAINTEEIELKNTIILHPLFVRSKLCDFEIRSKIVKLFNKNLFKVKNYDNLYINNNNDKTFNNSNLENNLLKKNCYTSNANTASNMLLMRNYEHDTLKLKSVENVKYLKKLFNNK